MLEPGITTNLIAGTVAVLVLEKMGQIIKGVIDSVNRKNGNGRVVPVCTPGPAVIDRLDGISRIQERTVGILGRIESDMRDQRNQIGAIRGDLGIVCSQLANKDKGGG